MSHSVFMIDQSLSIDDSQSNLILIKNCAIQWCAFLRESLSEICNRISNILILIEVTSSVQSK